MLTTAKDVLAKGKKVELEFVEKGGETYALASKVVRTVANDASGIAMMGLEFAGEASSELMDALGVWDAEAQVRLEKEVHKGWEILNRLQESVHPEKGLDLLCKETCEVIKTLKETLDFSECLIWRYSAGWDRLEWLTGVCEGDTDREGMHLAIADTKLRELLMEEQQPLLSSDADFGGFVLPDCINRWEANWIFPLCCRGDFLGLLHFGFKEHVPDHFATGTPVWLCYTLASAVAQAVDRWEVAHDVLERRKLRFHISEFVEEGEIPLPLPLVYNRILDGVCDIVERTEAVFRLYAEPSEELTICCVKGIEEERIPLNALCHRVGQCRTCKLSNAPNVSVCEECQECQEILDIVGKNRTLRIVLRNPGEELVGQVCVFVGEDFNLTERLRRRLELMSSALVSAMEGAVWHEIVEETHKVLETQERLAKGEADEFLEALVFEVARSMDAEACSLFLVDASRKELHLEATTKPDLTDDDWDSGVYRIDAKNHLTSIVAKTKKVLTTTDVDDWHAKRGTEPHYSEVPHKVAFSFIGAPLLDGAGNLLGVLRCSNKRAVPKGVSRKEAIIRSAFHRHDILLIENLAGIVAPLANLATDDREMNRRLVMQGHEVKSTVGVITSKAARLSRSLAVHTDVPPGTENALKDIQSAGKLVSMFTDDVSVSLSRSGVSWKPKACNLYGDIVSEVVDMVRPEAKGLHVMHEELRRVPQEYMVDPNRMKQVFYNLVSNAIKYNERRSGAYSSDSEERADEKSTVAIRSLWLKDKHALAVNVVGYGHEIAKDEVERIFDYGFRGARAKVHGIGLGIGLFICRKIADAASPGLEIVLSNRYNPVVFTVQLSATLIVHGGGSGSGRSWRSRR